MMYDALSPDSARLLSAIVWALLHTLWQGGLIALLLWVALTRLHLSTHRYRAASVALTLTAAAFAATATALWFSAAATDVPLTVASPATESVWAMLPTSALAAAAIPEPAFVERITDRIEAQAPLLVALWLAGCSFFLLRLLGGLWYLSRLRRRILPVHPSWVASLRCIAAQLRLSRPVALAASALVQAPVVLGYLRPIILLPVALVNQLTPDQVTAVLAHELAHLKRHDWLFNIFQTLVEATLYYHPAVWWMSAIIRAERENCCDDLAVVLTGNRLLYAKTLVQLQEIRVGATPALALGLPGARPTLLLRIKRILQPQHQQFLAMEKITATILLLALAGLAGLYNHQLPFIGHVAAQIGYPATDTESETAIAPAADTLPPVRNGKISYDDGRQRVEMEVKKNNITKLSINGQVIEAKDIPKYDSLTQRLLADLPEPPRPPAAPLPPSSPMWPAMPTPPTPAIAPLPPSSPVWPTMPAPPAPAEAPEPPHPSFGSTTTSWSSSSSTTVSTTQKNGKTIITIQQEDGEPVEMTVDGDQVLLNGIAIKADQEINLFPSGTTAPAHGFAGPGGAERSASDRRRLHDAMRDVADQLRDVENQLLDVEVQLRAQEGTWKGSADAWRKHESVVRGQIELMRKKIRQTSKIPTEYQHREMAQRLAELHTRLGEHHLRIEQQHRELQKRKVSPLADGMKSIIRAEGIKLKDDYTIKVTHRILEINGERQSDELHKKCTDYYRKIMGKGTLLFSTTISGSGEQ